MKVSGSVFDASALVPVLNIVLLFASDILVVLLAVILFPFLWKD
jgi:heme exporter protein B